MQHREFEPPEELRDIVKCFWHNVRDYGKTSSYAEVQPDSYAEIIFYFGDVLSVADNENLQPLPSPFIMGLINKPAVFHCKNRLEIIGIRCFPWTVCDLLGISPGNYGIRLFGHPIARLQPELKKRVDGGNINEALAVLKHYFLSARSVIATGSLLHKAGVAMRIANGAMPVSKVAAAAHATVRTLERNFKRSSGYTVKDVSALMRFEQVRNRLWHYPAFNIAALAHELGYADQSHLSREFKRYSGTTPAAFARKAKKEKPLHDEFVVFVQS